MIYYNVCHYRCLELVALKHALFFGGNLGSRIECHFILVCVDIVCRLFCSLFFVEQNIEYLFIKQTVQTVKRFAIMTMLTTPSLLK